MQSVQSFLREASFPALLGIFVVAWSLFATILSSSGPIHHDMSEAYVWGREFQLGYYKHPPFFAWVAGAWFLVMPRSTWAFAALSVVNSAVGLYGSWLLLGRFAEADRRRAATFMLLLTPFYLFLALKFNANSIFLSLWPWTAYFFIRSIDECRLMPAASLGALMAASVLSKYSAVLLGVTCLAAACVHPNRRGYFASAAPYVSVAVATALLAPHLWWLTSTDFLPFQYFGQKTGQSVVWSSWLSLKLLVGALLFHVPMMGLILVSRVQSPSGWLRTLRSELRDPRFRTLTVLALLPLILTAAAGPVLGIEVDPNMTIGMFPLMPLLFVRIVRPDDRRLLSIASLAVTALLAGSLLASPILASARLRTGQTASMPYIQLAEEATRAWRRATGSPLSYVAGSTQYPRGVAFYSMDAPSEFIGFDFRRAPWVTPEPLSRKGLLAVCEAGDADCLAKAAGFGSSESSMIRITVAHEFLGYSGRRVAFVLVVIPPRNDNPPGARQ